MMDDLLAALTTACQGGGPCTTPHDQVAWCPAWDCWLCWICRGRRNDAAVRVSLAAQAAMQAEAARA